jgi:hypothetical protein
VAAGSCCGITDVIWQHVLSERYATCANVDARRGPFSGYQATTGTGRPRRATRPSARHIDDFLTDLANANRPGNTIRAYRGDLIGFAAHHEGEIGELTAAPVRAFLGEIAGQVTARCAALPD